MGEMHGMTPNHILRAETPEEAAEWEFAHLVLRLYHDTESDQHPRAIESMALALRLANETVKDA